MPQLSTVLWKANMHPHVVSNRRFFWLHSACCAVVAKGVKPRPGWGQAWKQPAGALQVVEASSDVLMVSSCAFKDQRH